MRAQALGPRVDPGAAALALSPYSLVVVSFGDAAIPRTGGPSRLQPGNGRRDNRGRASPIAPDDARARAARRQRLAGIHRPPGGAGPDEGLVRVDDPAGRERAR